MEVDVLYFAGPEFPKVLKFADTNKEMKCIEANSCVGLRSRADQLQGRKERSIKGRSSDELKRNPDFVSRGELRNPGEAFDRRSVIIPRHVAHDVRVENVTGNVELLSHFKIAFEFRQE